MTGIRKVTITNTSGADKNFVWVGDIGRLIKNGQSTTITEAELNAKLAVKSGLYLKAAESDIDNDNVTLAYSSEEEYE